jgi:peptide deformylase
MTLIDIVKAGAPILQVVAKPVANFGSKALNELIEHLFFHMDHYQGAGMAAPQIGESQQIFVYGITQNLRYPEAKPVPKTVMINPEIVEFSEDKNDSYEGCLSLPRIRGAVPRSSTIKCRAYTPEGKLIERIVSGFEARIIQHETDHLMGILFPSRMTDMGSLMCSIN